jgi:hypothetical protein
MQKVLSSREISNFRFGKCRYNGRTDWADPADPNGFFSYFLLKIRAFGFKKSVSICRIRPIRSPIVSAFSKAEIVVEKFISR